ncbi:MAG: PAS domain-containing sensor histidine kinase [Anaerolineae bacterium]
MLSGAIIEFEVSYLVLDLVLGIVPLSAAYFLARRGKVRLSALIAIGVFFFGVALITASSGTLQFTTFHNYLILPILVASIFLGVRATLITALLAIAEIFMLYAITGRLDLIYESAPLAFIPLCTLTIIGAAVHQRKIEKVRRAEILNREERLRFILQNLPVMVNAVDNDETLHMWNRECERVTGYQAEEVLHKPGFFELLYPDPEYRAALLEDFKKQPNYRDVVCEMTAKDGSKRFVSWSNMAAQMPDTPWRELSVGVDVTVQHQQKRELKAITSIALALRNAKSRSEMVNILLDQAVELLEADGASIGIRRITPSSDQMVLEGVRGRWKHELGTVFSTSRGIYGHVLTTNKVYCTDAAAADPMVVNWHLLDNLPALAAAPLTVDDVAIGVLGVGRNKPFTEGDVKILAAICDIAANAIQRAEVMEKLELLVSQRTAELERAYTRLETLDRLKAKLIDDISHELRHPASTLSVYLHLIERDPSQIVLPQRIQRLKEQIERLNKLIDGVINAMAIERRRGEWHSAQTDLNLIIKQIVSKVERRLSDLQKLHFTPAADLPPIRGDSSLLTQAIENLIDNAVKYTPRGTISVTTKYETNSVQVIIADTGMGIEQEDLPNIYDRFYRGKRAGQSNIPGIGLGLSAARSIAELHNGSIRIESLPDVGTTAILHLPIEPSVESHRSEGQLIQVIHG